MHKTGGGEAASYIVLEQNTAYSGLLAQKKYSSTLLQRKEASQPENLIFNCYANIKELS